MGGVDKSDQLLSYYGFSHRTVKWWRQAFFHLLDMAIVNAYIHYRMSSQPGRKLDHKNFRIELAKSFLGGTDSLSQNPTPRLNVLPPQARLTERHFPEVPPCASGRASQPLCVVCYSKRGENVPPLTNVSTVIYLCVLYHALSCIIPKQTLYAI